MEYVYADITGFTFPTISEYSKRPPKENWFLYEKVYAQYIQGTDQLLSPEARAYIEARQKLDQSIDLFANLYENTDLEQVSTLDFIEIAESIDAFVEQAKGEKNDLLLSIIPQGKVLTTVKNASWLNQLKSFTGSTKSIKKTIGAIRKRLLSIQRVNAGLSAKIEKLPIDQGDFPFIPKKHKGNGFLMDKDGGFLDSKNNSWKWHEVGQHWDVTDTKGKHLNITIDGRIHHVGTKKL